MRYAGPFVPRLGTARETGRTLHHSCADQGPLRPGPDKSYPDLKSTGDVLARIGANCILVQCANAEDGKWMN